MAIAQHIDQRVDVALACEVDASAHVPERAVDIAGVVGAKPVDGLLLWCRTFALRSFTAFTCAAVVVKNITLPIHCLYSKSAIGHKL